MAQPGQSTGLLIRLSGVRIPLDPPPFSALSGTESEKIGGDRHGLHGEAAGERELRGRMYEMVEEIMGRFEGGAA